MKKSILAGVFIGMGGIVFLSYSRVDKLAAAFLFSVGLLAVLLFHVELFTGMVSKPWLFKTPSKLIIAFFGNLIGAFLLALISWTRPGLIERAQSVCEAKLATGQLEWIAMSVLCGCFIAVAVRGFDRIANHYSTLIVVLGVMGFILCGSEHVIADFYYFSAAQMIGRWDVILRLWVCAAGNLIGGYAVGKAVTI